MIEINGDNVFTESVVQVSQKKEQVALAAKARKLMERSRTYIEKRLAKGEVIYGVNTGFGALSSVNIKPDQISELQVNLIRSHAMGLGTPFSQEETRAIMLLRANALSRGHSGVRPEVVEKILEFLKAEVIPVIPSQGSVGASGDLAPLAHLALSLIGEGEVWSADGPVSTKSILAKKKIKPLQLQAKEGLSLINGCQVMTAVGILSLHRANQLSRLADIAGAMSLEGVRGSRSAFHPDISASRPHKGEQLTAKNLLKILGKKSEISESHLDCDRVQDAYSFRCMPAVHGAVKDALFRANDVLMIEANSSTDNPLVFTESDQIVSCGNFHGEPVAFQLDFSAIALAALSSISECRIAKLINPNFTRLPAFLTKQGGLNSGMMIVQVAAASLVSENKIHAHPASVDSIPTSVDKEDHVSMGTIAACKLNKVVENVSNVLAMEFLCAYQALCLLKPLESAAGVKAAFKEISKEVTPIEQDRFFNQDVKKIREMMDSGRLLMAVEKEVGPL